MANDALTQNSAFSGALKGCTTATQGLAPTAAVLNACAAFAGEFDTLLAANGAAVTNASRGIMTEAIVAGLFQDSNALNLAMQGGGAAIDPSVNSSWANLAAKAVLIYAAAVAKLA